MAPLLPSSPEATDDLMQSLNRLRFEDICLAASVLLAVGVGITLIDYAYDDAYITYRYARNISEGHGFVYNLEHNHLGTTTPFYTLLLAALSFALPIPLASGLLSIASMAGAVICIDAIGRHAGVRFAGPAAGLFLLLNQALYSTFGGEMLFVYALLIPLGLWLHITGRTRLAAVVFAAAILSRMDAGLFVAIVYARDLAVERRLAWREASIVAGLLLPWFIYSMYVFGEPFPSTLAIKMALGRSGQWKLFGEGLWQSLLSLPEFRPRFIWIMLPLCGLGLWRIVRHERVLIVFPLNTLLFILAYHFVLRVAFSHWYLVNVYVTLALLLGAGLREAGAIALGLYAGSGDPLRTKRRWSRVVGAGALLVLASAVGLHQFTSALAVSRLEPLNARRLIYTRLGQWLADTTPETASVMYYEIGYVGWFSRRTIIDPVGLVTPGGLEGIESGRGGWIFERYDPDYLVHNVRGPALQIAQHPWFQERYVEVQRFSHPGYAGELVVFAQR